MVFSQGVVWNIICFLYRHKSSNRVQRTYQTSPEHETNQEQKEDQVFIYLYIEASLLSCLPVHVWSFNLACSSTTPNIAASGYRTNYIHCRLSISCLDIPKDLLSSKNQLLLQWYFVHFLLFYISWQGNQTNQPSHCNIHSSEKLICFSTVTICCCAKFPTNLTCVCISMYK